MDDPQTLTKCYETRARELLENGQTLSERIEAEGLTVRHVAEAIELWQQLVDYYDDLLENPPDYSRHVSPDAVAETIQEYWNKG